MIRRGLLTTTLAAMALLACGAAAQAEFRFDYTTRLTSLAVNSGPDGTISAVPGKAVTYSTGTGTTFTFTGLDGTSRNALPATNALFGDIAVESTDSTLRMYDLGFTFSLLLNDSSDAGTTSDPVNFSGRLVGSVAASTTDLSFVSFVPAENQAVTLDEDGNLYSIALTSATPPDQEFTGRLAATVTAVPEPMSMALMGIGGAAAFGVFRRRRRNAAERPRTAIDRRIENRSRPHLLKPMGPFSLGPRPVLITRRGSSDGRAKEGPLGRGHRSPAEGRPEVGRELLDRVGPCRLRPRRDRFGTLVRAIIGQQISAKAAASIHLRLLALQEADRHRPEALLELGESGIRTAGLSGVKARYVLNLAEAVQDGRVPLARIGRFGDDEIVARLTTVKGIGTWTAEMFLIFALNRPDVLPIGDLGVRVGIRDHYGLEAMPAPRDCIPLAERWRPYRSVAIWYIWRGLDQPKVPSPPLAQPAPEAI